MIKQPLGYLSYLLRLWQSGSRDNAVWRASLQNPMTGERWGFATLKELFTFLEAQADAAEPQADSDCLSNCGQE